METMTSSTLPVDIKIASPCSARWDDMPGGDTVRSCAHCARKVYNLSEMPTAEAADLIRAAEGRLCVRFYRRADGTIMTKDCPTGLRAVRVRAARVIGVAFSSLLVWSGFNLSSRPRSEYPYLLRLLLNQSDARPVMGDMAAPTAPLKAEDSGPGRAEHVMGRIVTLPMARTAPVTGDGIRNDWTVRSTSDPEVVIGDVASVSTEDVSGNDVAPASTDKPFLRGLEVDNAPRDDPFAPANGSKKRAAR